MLQEGFQNLERVSDGEKNQERIQHIPLEEGKSFVLRDLSDGTASFLLETDQGEAVINFNKDVVSSDIQLKRGQKWEADVFQRELEMGEWDDGRRITTFFHELGHFALMDMQRITEKFILEEITINHLLKFGHLTPAQMCHAVSLVKEAETRTVAEERAAWAWGLLKMRQVGKKYHVDLFSAFPKDERGKRTPSIREFINTRVATYKNKARQMIHDHVPRLSEEDVSLLLATKEETKTT